MGLVNYNIEKYSPKQLVIIPLALLAISIVMLGFTTLCNRYAGYPRH